MIYKLQNGGNVKLQNTSKPFESATAKSYFSGLKDYLLHQTKSFTPSQYKPTKGLNIRQQYYTRPGLKEEVVLNLFGGTDSNAKGPLGKNYFYKDFDDVYNTLSLANESRTTSNGTLGRYGVSAGVDDRGRYISFIDNFDHVFIPGKGIPIYDRIYEDEIESLYNPNLSALNEGDWITRSPELKKISKYKYKNGGIVKLQNAGSIPEYNDIEQIAKYNREHGTNFWKMSQVLEHDKQQAQKKVQDKKKSFWEILAGHPESAGEAILNKAIETANNTELPETRKKIYNDTAKSELGTTAGSLLTLPMLGEFSTYGLLGGSARLAGGMAGSAAGSYGLGKAGELGDRTFGTTWMKPAGQIIGGFAGWGPGSNMAYKGALDLASAAPKIAKIGATNRFIGDAASKLLGKSVDKTTFVPAQTINKSYVFPQKQTRIVSEGTYPLYTGPQHSIAEVVNPDGTINPRAALRIEREVADNIPGAYRMELRQENPVWHITDPNTWTHTRNVAQSAWTVPTPKGLTKQDQMVAALGHDFGKMVSGDGHAQSSAALIEQIFPDVTEQQLTAISEHMSTPKSILGKVTKQADILNGKPAITRFIGDNGKIRLRLPSHTAEKPRELVLDPQGNNKFRVHTRTWDGDHIPAEMSKEDKNTLFNALYEELPEGSEILFPESGPGNYATRGTIAGLQRLARDSRFKPTGNGVLQYVDKDGSIKTFEGTGFRKPKLIKPLSKPISEAEILGISKGERSNPKTLEDPQYWGYQQWNQRYNAAVESGNWNEVQRLRDLHFKIKVPSDKRIMMSEDEPFIFAHTTDADFNVFDSKHFGKTDAGYHGKAFYFGATVPTEAKAWQNFTFKGRRPIHNYGKNKKYFYIKGSPLQREPGSSYDYFSDSRDGIFFNLNDPIQTNEFLIGHPEQIKLSDAMTFNDNGTLIPIVKRDNFYNPDIRYKQGGVLKAQK